MRQIVLDTETTGLSWEKGNRVVEIGCIELINRRPSGRTYQQYLNPGREMEPGAAEVTGLTLDLTARGMGLRSNRYSMLIKDGKLAALNVEGPGKFEVSDAQTMLAQAKG